MGQPQPATGNTMFGIRTLSDMWKHSRLLLVLILLILAAAICFVVAIALPDSPEYRKTHQVLLAVGSATLSGGVFAWLSKLAQLGGLFKTEIESVMYAKEYVSRRKDAIDLWVNLTRSLFSDQFPNLVDRIHSDALRTVLPTDRQYYVKGVKRIITLEAIPGEKGCIKVAQEMHSTLVVARSRTPVVRISEFVFDPDATPADRISSLIESQKSKYYPPGTPFPPSIAPVAIDKVRGQAERLPDGLSRVVFEVELAPGAEYAIFDQWETVQDTKVDNCVALTSSSYVDGLEVDVGFVEDDLIVQFHPLGGAEFVDNGPRAGNVRMRKRAKNLLFSDAGFLLTVQTRK